MNAEREFIAHVKSCKECQRAKPSEELCAVGAPLAKRATDARWRTGLNAQKLRTNQENALAAFGVRKSPLERFEKKEKKRR